MSLYAEKTKVPVGQSRMEIDRLLDRHHCTQRLTAYDSERGMARVQFNLANRIVRFDIGLPKRDRCRSDAEFEQQERQRWRALLLVIKAKLESVENQIATFEEEFLAHIVLPNDQTVGELITPRIAAVYEQHDMRLLLAETNQ